MNDFDIFRQIKQMRQDLLFSFNSIYIYYTRVFDVRQISANCENSQILCNLIDILGIW